MRTAGERVLPNEGLGGGSRVGNRKEKGEVFWRGSGGAVSDRASAEDVGSAMGQKVTGCFSRAVTGMAAHSRRPMEIKLWRASKNGGREPVRRPLPGKAWANQVTVGIERETIWP